MERTKDMEEVIQMIKDVGFPIAVSIYLLYRDSTVIKSLSESINQNTIAVTRLVDELNSRGVGE